MAFDSTNKKLYVDTSAAKGGITPWEIAQCIGDYRVTKFGRDIGLLCTSPKVNPMARYKPEDYDTKTKLTEAQRKANGFGFGSKALYFTAGGSSIPHAVYQYVPPKGGSASPFRLLDFDGYYHKAVSPLFLNFPSKLYVDWANGVSIIANSTGKTNYDPSTCVKLGEVMRASDDVYVALYIFKDANHQWLLPTDVKVNELSVSIFPTIVFSGNSASLPEHSGRVFPYLLYDIANGEGDSYTLIAVGVNGLTYQTDKIPLSSEGTGSKAIGVRSLFSMELEEDGDRKTFVAVVGKVLTGLTGTFTPNFGTFKKGYSDFGGYPSYKLTQYSSTLVLYTPKDWFFTSQDTLFAQIVVYNQQGYIYSNAGEQLTSLTYSSAITLGESDKTYAIENLTSGITGYNFTDMSNSSLSTTITLRVTVRVYRRQDFTGEYVEIYNGSINISKS